MRVLIYKEAAIISNLASIPNLTVTIYLDAKNPFPVVWAVKGQGTNLDGV